jgi:autotransporter-associated beta strand protein
LSAITTATAIVTNSAVTPATLALNLSEDKSFNGRVAGPVAVIKTGAAIQTLSGANAYTGNTTINAGTLVVTRHTLVNTTTVTVTNGAVLQLDFAGAETNQVAGLVLNGVNQTPGLYNAGNISPYLAGAGNLLVTSPVATNPTNISYAISGDTLTLTWPGSHLGWYAQSNSVSLANTNFWFDIPGSQLATNMVIYISPAQTNVFYRLRNP